VKKVWIQGTHENNAFNKRDSFVYSYLSG